MSNELDGLIPSGIENAIKAIPSISPALSRLKRLSGDVASTSVNIVDLVRMDPGLTAKVMKLVNSAFFALNERVRSLDQAISMLGVVTVKNLALTSSVVDSMSFADTGVSIDSDGLWEHCISVAVASTVFGRYFQVPAYDEELFFVAGLLHDLGKLPFIKGAPIRYNAALEESLRLEIVLRYAEVFHYGFGHDALGGVIARQWKLDPAITDAIVLHHARLEDVRHANGNGDLVDVVMISNNTCKSMNYGFGGDPAVEEHYLAVREKFNCSEEDLENCLRQIEREVSGMREILK